MIDHRNRVAELMLVRDTGTEETPDGELVDEAIRRQISLLWQTRPLRRARLFVEDEVEIALSYFRDVFLPVVPALYARWERALGSRPGCFLRLGSWIGGDRDGNPFVKADSLRNALAGAARTVLTFYLDQVHLLGAELSISSGLSEVTPKLIALADASAIPARPATVRALSAGADRRLRQAGGDLHRADRPRRPAHAEAARRGLCESGGVPARSGGDRVGLWRQGRRARPADPRGRDVRLSSRDARSEAECRRARAGGTPSCCASPRSSRLSGARRGRAGGVAPPRAGDAQAARQPLCRIFGGDPVRAGDRPCRRRGACEIRPGLDHRLHHLQMRQRLGPARGSTSCSRKQACGGPAIRPARRSCRCRCSRRSAIWKPRRR